MAISSPANSIAELQLLPGRYVVWLGDDSGNAPHADSEVDYLEVLSVTRTAGGSRVDGATLRFNLARAGLRLQDTFVPTAYHRQIEIRRLDDDGEPTEIIVWGFISAMEETIAAEESLQLTIRIDPFVFGKPLTEIPYWDPDADAVIWLHRPLIFNPTLDMQPQWNRSSRRQELDDDFRADPYLFVDPDSLRTQPARNLQALSGFDEGRAFRWSVAQAVHRVCWLCNPDETHITNPALALLEMETHDLDEADFLNVALEYGKSLPELLDDLLRPVGFGWYLQFRNGVDNERRTDIRLYRRGAGVEVDLLLQRVGERRHARRTNIEQLHASIDIASLANRVIVRGSRKRYEVTVPLIPGWSTEEDAVDAYELEDDPALQRKHPHLGRKYVLNEAGDYNAPFRTDVQDFFDLRPLLQEEDAETPDPVLIVRRKFERGISRSVELESDAGAEEAEAAAEVADSIGYYLEYWDRDVEEAADPNVLTDPGWTRIKSGFAVLDKECGILFSKPDFLLLALHEEDIGPEEELPEDVDFPGLYLRMTACIDGDRQIEALADRSDDSPNGEEITLLLDLSDKFHLRQVHPDSRFFADSAAADTRDDRDDLEAYAERVRQIEDAAVVGCSVVLPGVEHAELSIGKLVRKIDGRDIDLQARGGDDPRRLQVVGINYQMHPQPRTELLLETFDAERAAL